MFKVTDCCKQVLYLSRRFSITSVVREEQKKPKRKVSETIELINLVDQNDKILGIKPKSESVKLARKLNLTLEKQEDSKYGKMYPVFKMVSITDLLKAEAKATTAKTLKKLPINHRISDNDLQIKLQTVRKWLTKSYEVHIAIAGNNATASLTKAVFQKIKEDLKDESRIIDLREKEGAIKFIVLPQNAAPNSKGQIQKEASNKE